MEAQNIYQGNKIMKKGDYIKEKNVAGSEYF